MTFYVHKHIKVHSFWNQCCAVCTNLSWHNLIQLIFRLTSVIHQVIQNIKLFSNVSATPIGQMGLKMGWNPFGNGVRLIRKKALSDSPIWQIKKRELLLLLSFLVTKPIKLDLSKLHYGPHYEPHYRTQGCCVIRKNNITAPITNPIKDTLVPLWTN